MRTGTKRQARVEHYVNGVFIRHIAPARADPQAFTEAHRVEVIHPFALPVLVFQLFDFMHETGTQQRILLQHRDHFFHIGLGVKQADNVSILESNGNGTRFH